MNTLQTPQGYKACRVTIPQTGDVLTHALVLESCGIRVALQTRRAAPDGGMYLDAIARLEPEPLPVKGYDVTYPTH